MGFDKDKAQKAVYDFLAAIGEDPDREGLRDTPQRVALMYQEILHGEKEGPLKFFSEGFSGEAVAVKNIEFHSICEHHLLPFYGAVHICYMPLAGKLLGFSQLARIVDFYAGRLQVQEKMTGQIADLLAKDTNGAAVVIEASHLCITMRGAKKPSAKAVTTALRGVFKNDPLMREEAMRLLS